MLHIVSEEMGTSPKGSWTILRFLKVLEQPLCCSQGCSEFLSHCHRHLAVRNYLHHPGGCQDPSSAVQGPESRSWIIHQLLRHSWCVWHQGLGPSVVGVGISIGTGDFLSAPLSPITCIRGVLVCRKACHLSCKA